MTKDTLDMLVEGGNAKPGPATAPKLAQYKMNVGKLFTDINEKTKEYKGMNVPVKIEIDTDNGNYSIKVGIPPIASLIKKEMGIKKFGAEKKEKTEVEKTDAKPKAEKGKPAAAVETPVETATEEKKPVEKKEKIIYGNLTIEQAIKIAKMKKDSMLAKTMRSALKEVIGACVSMPITVENKNPKDVLVDIDKGNYDDKLK